MNRISTRKRESYLQVRQPAKGALSKGWKKKYVIIRQNKSSNGKSVLLELYIEKNAHHKPVISMLLENVDSITRIPYKTREYAFEIKSGERNLLCVASDSEIETLEWMEIFQQHLLMPKKELGKLPEIEDDFCKVSVIPNKDSQHLDLQGDYYAVVKEMKVRLYDPYTGQMKIEWDMHHLKKVLVSSKCHFRDKERIMHYVVSKRSEHGKAELHFFSLQARRLADAIFGVLTGNIHVTSRQTRSASMVFEITSKDLKRMMKDKDPDTQSLASVAMDTSKEEERSVQTIPEEMGPSEMTESPKNGGGEMKDGEAEKVQNGNGEHKEEDSPVQSNGHELKEEDSPVQSNGHVAENGQESETNGDVKENEVQNLQKEESKVQDTKEESKVQDTKEESKVQDTKEESKVQDTKEESKVQDTKEEESKVQNSKEEESKVQDTKEEESEVQDSKEDKVEVQDLKEEETTPDANIDTDKADISQDDTTEETNKQNTNEETNKDNSEQNGVENGGESIANVETVEVKSEDNEVPDDQAKESEQSDKAPVTNGDVPPGDEAEKAQVEESQEEQHPDSNGLEKDDIEDAQSPETTDEVSPSVDKPDESDNVQDQNRETADGKDPVNDNATVKEHESLPHDTSTDSGFINDAGDQNGTAVSNNTNNNNSRESLNCTVEGEGDNERHQDNVSNGGDSSKNSERMQPDVLPVVGMPVDVADLEEISVIVYNEDSPEVLV
ncbi:uncharacterized protein [Amphiura filiformis]|uniref:uncharacterized protein n=1 Tax=Amphiura filiformis TaxID=82378 RepID=UPI003B212916